jgi:manganese/zinc/iron transport system substrate-binding protein
MSTVDPEADMLSRSLLGIRVFAVAVAAVALGGCGRTSEPAEADGHRGHTRPGPVTVTKTFSGTHPIRAVCTTGMVADLVRNVGGGHVTAGQLMGEGVDPHLYKASPGDVNRLNEADIIFYSGLHLEGKMADVFVRMARKKPTFAVTEYIPEGGVLENPDGAFDPHLWFDVSLWREAAGVVRDALVAFDPKHASDYRRRADAYQSELAKLHDEVKTRLAAIPKDQRVLVTAHDAFRYFGRAYNVEVRAIQGISTESEAGVREVNALVAFLVDKRIKAVFVESSVSDKNVTALLEGCAARGHKVVVGGELFSDAMGKDGTPAGTYVGMIRHNVDTIVNALR